MALRHQHWTCFNGLYIIEGSLNSKLPTIWTVEKQSRVVKSAERRCNSAKVRRKKIHPRQMLEKSRNAVFFQWFVCRVSRKVGLLKRRVRSHVVSKIARRCGEKHILKSKCTKHVIFGALFDVLMSKNCTPLWRKAHSEVKMLKNWGSGSTFWCYDVEKLHATVAKSTFWSQNVKKLRVWEHFLMFWCRKICTPLWREAHSEVNMLKNWGSRSTFWCSDVEKLHAAVAKSAFWSENVSSGQFFEVLMSKN